jgi:hypothetical protein
MPGKYLFRGTTEGFMGSPASRSIPRTSTSRNPAKAATFAVYCSAFGRPVLYIALYAKVLPLGEPDMNVLGEIEEEVAFPVPPQEFYNYCEGYLTLMETLEIFRRLSIGIPAVIHIHNLDDVLEAIQNMDDEQIDTFYEIAKDHLK